MNAPTTYGLTTVAFIGVLSVGALRWRSAIPVVPQEPPTIRRTIQARTSATGRELAEAEDLLVSNDPFRLANQPASVRYDPESENGSASAPPVGPPRLRPTMVLKAVIGGPPWQAVVDGLPGQPAGTIVRAGSRFDQFVVRAVTRDSIVISGADTIWVLSFRRAQ